MQQRFLADHKRTCEEFAILLPRNEFEEHLWNLHASEFSVGMSLSIQPQLSELPVADVTFRSIENGTVDDAQVRSGGQVFGGQHFQSVPQAVFFASSVKCKVLWCAIGEMEGIVAVADGFFEVASPLQVFAAGEVTFVEGVEQLSVGFERLLFTVEVVIKLCGGRNLRDSVVRYEVSAVVSSEAGSGPDICGSEEGQSSLGIHHDAVVPVFDFNTAIFKLERPAKTVAGDLRQRYPETTSDKFRLIAITQRIIAAVNFGFTGKIEW